MRIVKGELMKRYGTYMAFEAFHRLIGNWIMEQLVKRSCKGTGSFNMK